MKTKILVTKCYPQVGIERGLFIASDSKSNTLLSELVRHVLRFVDHFIFGFR